MGNLGMNVIMQQTPDKEKNSSCFLHTVVKAQQCVT